MNSPNLAEHAARVAQRCELLQSHIKEADHQNALIDSLAELAKYPPEGPALLVGLFRQSVTLGEEAIHRLQRERGVSSPHTIAALRRSVSNLKTCARDLADSAKGGDKDVSIQRRGSTPSS